MDLKISYNWLKEYAPINAKLETFIKDFSAKSMSIERHHKLSPSFSGVITATVLETRPHPNADKLKLAKVSDGKTVYDIVCGAPNVAAGQVVALAKVGASLIDEHGATFEIKKASIRGEESNGMLCSARELQLGTDHEGIMVLPSDTPVGKPLEKVIDFNDYALDIEVTSNRPDAMSVMGLAREASAVFGSRINEKVPKVKLPRVAEVPLSVQIKDKKNCRRYQGVVMKNVTIQPSPLWMQQRLIVAGVKPINNIVDITNYILLEYGQPMHAFDYEKLEGSQINVRKATKGERIEALDGNTYELSEQDLVIADKKKPVAIAGIMGGQQFSITPQTTTIVFESANFDGVSVRKTSRRLNLSSDSSQLFEKQLHPEAVFMATLRAIELTAALAGGVAATPIMDEYHEPLRDKKIKFKTNQVNHYLGIDIPVNQVKRILTSLGFGVRGDRDLIVEVPWWRHHDVDQGHDIIEEVARIYGYHNLPSVTPQGNIPIVEQDPILQREAEIKKLLQGSGFTELYSYAMISARHFEKANLSAKDALELSNPLSEDMVYMRTSLIPQLLEVIGANCNAFSRQRVFELARVYLPVSEQDLPKEMPRLCGAVVGEEDVFFQGKGVVEQLLESLGIHECRFDPFTSHLFSQLLNIFKDNRSLGRVGMIKAEITKNFGIDTPVVVFDLDVNALTESAQSDKVYRPVPQYPSVARDFSIVVEKSVLWQTVKFLVSQIDPLIVDVEYLDTYTGQSLPEGKKSLSFRVVFRSTEKTLTSEEADRISEAIINGLKQKFELSVR